MSGPRPRTRVRGAIVAVVVLWTFTAAVPVWQYVEARTVPSGADTQDATVTSVARGTTANGVSVRSDNGLRGKIATVDLPDGTEDAVVLAYRWDYPETGDTLEVYAEDGELRSPEQASLLLLVTGIVLGVFWPTALLGYLRSRRRGEMSSAVP